MWTSATCVAGLVASSRGEQPAKPDNDRTLSEADFEFRGGFPRRADGLFAHTRVDEHAL